MTGWARKRFWAETSVVEVSGGFEVRLDDRPIRTPAKAELVLPTRALADRVAAEWEAQDAELNPNQMPATRMANSAIDKVVPQRAAIEEHLAGYGETDLLCYRADGPAALVTRQADLWDPLLAWAEEQFAARLLVTSGIIPQAQDPAVIAALAAPMAEYNVFELAGFHDLVTLPGSLILGLAAASNERPAHELWDISRLDELWQIEQWGDDEEAENNNKLKVQAFLDAHRFFSAASEQ